MNTSPFILCFGELLIDMISTNPGNLIASDGFLKKFGGAPANTAMGLARLGIPVGFMGKVGNDPFGHFLKHILEKNNVDTRSLLLSDPVHTTLAFVSLTDDGQRDFFFYKGAHDTILSSEVTLPKHTTIFHFGSLTQITESTKQTTAKLIAEAKAAHCIISYDPNIRESLWQDMTQARTVILDTFSQVDIVKLNEKEAELLSEEIDIEKAAQKLFRDHFDILFITLGNKGCYYKTKNFHGTVPTIPVDVVDTTGAGDAFNAGYLEAVSTTGKRFSDMTEEELIAAIRKATVIAALTTEKKGAIDAFPSQEEITAHL